MNNVTFHEVQLFNHLVEIIIYLSRTHHLRSKFYIFTEGLGSRIAQLLTAPQKHLKLTALKFFRQCVGLQDEHYNKELISKRHFGPILNIVYETMPRDNLLNSACLELFEYIKRENLKPIIRHLAEEYGPRLREITYVDTFQTIQLRYDQMLIAQDAADMTLFSNDNHPNSGTHTPPNSSNNNNPHHSTVNGARGWQGLREIDADQDAYFNTSDDEDELQDAEPRDSPTAKRLKTSPKTSTPPATATTNPISNGVASSPLLKSLVDYPDDEDDDNDPDLDLMDTTPTLPSSTSSTTPTPSLTPAGSTPTLAPSPLPPTESLREKRRRDLDDDDDELGKLSSSNSHKRRNSASSGSSAAGSGSGSHNFANSTGGGSLKRKKGFSISASGGGGGGKTDSPPSRERRGGVVVGGKKLEIHFGSAGGGDVEKEKPSAEDSSRLEGEEEDGEVSAESKLEREEKAVEST